MIPSSAFQTFYEGYLGLNNAARCNGVSVSVSPYRDQPINKHYFYKLIATNYHGERVLSCSPDFRQEEILWLCQNLDFDRIGHDFLPCQLPGRKYEQSCMYRMLLEAPWEREQWNEAETQNQENGAGSQERWNGTGLQKQQAGPDMLREICLPDGRPVTFLYLEANKKYLAVTGDTLLGYCKLSDVILGYGNIVVWVDEAFRRLGLARALTALTLHRCRLDGILPMYIVKSDNQASIALAKQLGFQIVQMEWIASITH